MRECVLETVLGVGKKAGLIQQFRIAQFGESATEFILLQFGYWLKDRIKDVLPNDRGRLQKALLASSQAIDTRGEDCVDGGRYPQLLQWANQAIVAAFTNEDVRFNQRTDALL